MKSDTPNNPTRRNVLVGMGATAALAAGPASAAADLAGQVARPMRFRGKLGAFEMIAISDGGFFRDAPRDFLAVNAEEADVSDVLQNDFYPPDFYELGFAPAIINTGNELVLFDTGIGNVRRPEAGQLRDRLALVDLTPEQIDVVVLSHFHIDHTGGLIEDGAPAFPNARYVASAVEFDYWTTSDEAANSEFGVVKLSAQFARENVARLAEKMTFVGHGQNVARGITAMDVAGHTPGHLAFNIESEGERLVIASDALIHPSLSFRRPDWEHIFDVDGAQAAAARKSLLSMLAADRVPFMAYHMPFPNVGFAEPSGDGYRYVSVGYQFSRFQ